MKIKQLLKRIGDDPAILLRISAWRKAFKRGLSPRNVWAQDGRFKTRHYESYDEYISHQRSKLDNKLLEKGSSYFSEYDKVFYDALYGRLGEPDIQPQIRGKSVLCLAARLGTEVRAFLDRGAFAIGIDLNPGGASRFVLEGDFHHLQFAGESVDVIYTNSLDHLYDKDKLAHEIHRVLKKSGIAIIEAFQPNEEVAFGSYESFNWSDVSEIEVFFTQHGFTRQKSTTFALPWHGTQFVFVKLGN